MTNDGQIIGETDFKIIDKNDLERIEELKNLDDLDKGGNLRDDLIGLGLLDYDKLSEEDKKIFDELENEKRENDLYEI